MAVPPDPAATTPAAAPDGPAGADLPSHAGRYRLEGEIARGGMGVVCRAHDPDLGRTLAVKVLLARYKDDAVMARRFLEEAQVCGQLQHPGVPPVHELGTLPDGRPFFAMKLVKGHTLAELLQLRPPVANSPGSPGVLQVFEQVCQTVAFAHSKGILHRDLKPHNVMVGAFGEVQVMDWGLAKLIMAAASRNQPTASTTVGASTVFSTRAASDAATQAGTVLGTPAYMAPEQARGQVDYLDERADVFGLGAVLCEILTGRPPYTAASNEELLKQAAQGEPGEARERLAKCGADAELVRLALACLEFEPAGRPHDAGAVARAVAAYRAGVEERLRQAERERAAAEARATEERKRRRVLVALGLAVLLLVVGCGAAAWLVQQQRQAREAEAARRRQDALAAVAVQLAEARNLRRQATEHPLGDPARFRQAQAAAGQAVKLIDASEAAEELRPEAEALVKELGAEVTAAEIDRVLLTALLEVRGPREGPKYRTDDRGFAVALAEPGADEQFHAAFKKWGLDVDATPTAAAAAQLRKRPAAVVAEVIAALDEWASERRRQGKARAQWERLSALAAALDDGPGAGRRRELRGLLAAGQLPVERALGALGVLLRPVPVPFDVGPGEDRQHLRRLAAKTDPEKEPVLGLLTLTRALLVAGDDAIAERLLRAALRARPREVVLHNTLGELLVRQQPQRWGEAVECHAAARALRPELGEALAQALVRSGRVEDGLALFGRLVREKPRNPWLHFRHGYAFLFLNRYQEAAAACRAAIRLEPDFPEAHYNLGLALGRNGLGKEAEAAFRRALRLAPGNALVHGNLGNTLLVQGRNREAEAAFREALRLKPDYATASSNLGAALCRQGRYKEAEAACRKAIRLAPDDALAHGNLASALYSQGRFREAEAACREALRLRPVYPDAQYNLGTALLGQARFKEAEAAFRAALRWQPNDADACFNLGLALRGQARHREAEAAFREALRLKPGLAVAHFTLGLALNAQGRFREAEAAFREALRLKYNEAEVCCQLGEALREQGRFADALDSFRRGHALGSKRPGWRYPSAAWVRECERLVELDRRLPAVLMGDAEPANATEDIEFASLCRRYKRRHSAAVRLFADAFAADPRLAADLGQQVRYNAACSAALASAGKGEDAGRLPDRVVLTLRRQALRWLRADLAAYTTLAGRGDPKLRQVIRQRLEYWQQDADLAAVRDAEALEKLPEYERDAWRQFWADVDALRRKTREDG